MQPNMQKVVKVKVVKVKEAYMCDICMIINFFVF